MSPDSATQHECAAGQATSSRGRKLDAVALVAIALLIVLTWLPTLTSGSRVNPDEDALLNASRHEVVRKSIVEYRTFPLRSHWFGGGYPTLGEAQDPALNPLVVLTVLFGSIVGPKLIVVLAALISGLSTYALARWVLEYTRWGALFSGLIVGTCLFVPDRAEGGNIGEACVAYIPLCMLLIALACRGRRTALFLLPLLLYTMLSDGKQSAFVAILYLALFCLLDALPMFSTLAPDPDRGRLDMRALKVLIVAVGVTLFVGMVRFLPAIEFISGRGGMLDMDLRGHEGLDEAMGVSLGTLLRYASGVTGSVELGTIGLLPMALFVAAICWFPRRALPWVIAAVLFAWLAIANQAPLDPLRILHALPVFNTIVDPYKYFGYQVSLSMAIASGGFFWLLSRLRHRWMEHACAVVLIAAGVGSLYPNARLYQLNTYTAELPPTASVGQEEFYNVQGLNLPRNRAQPSKAVTYLNVLRNIGTIDWYTAMPIAESAVPRYFVDASDRYILNPRYVGEAFLVEDGDGAGTRSKAEAIFAPNSIVAEVNVVMPSVLVVNQNYYPAWRTDRGELFERDGLIAVRLEEIGSYTVHLRYLPCSFVVGLAVSILSIVSWTLACWRLGGRSETSPAEDG